MRTISFAPVVPFLCIFWYVPENAHVVILYKWLTFFSRTDCSYISFLQKQDSHAALRLRHFCELVPQAKLAAGLMTIHNQYTNSTSARFRHTFDITFTCFSPRFSLVKPFFPRQLLNLGYGVGNRRNTAYRQRRLISII